MAATCTAAAAARPLWLGGREYMLAPLTLRDWAEYDAWLSETWAATVSRGLDGMRPEIVQDVERDVCTGVDVSSPIGQDIANSPAGVARLVWQHARRHHPGMTPDDWQTLLKTHTDTLRALQVVGRCNQVDAPDIAQPAAPAQAGGGTMRALYALMAERYGWTAAQVADHTPGQLAMYLRPEDNATGPSWVDPRTGHRIVRVSSLEEATALLARLQEAKGG